jgi:hypothetical protein
LRTPGIESISTIFSKRKDENTADKNFHST